MHLTTLLAATLLLVASSSLVVAAAEPSARIVDVNASDSNLTLPSSSNNVTTNDSSQTSAEQHDVLQQWNTDCTNWKQNEHPDNANQVSSSDPYGIGPARMIRMMELYRQYSAINSRIESGEATRSDLSTLQQLSSTVDREYQSAPTEVKERTRDIYQKVKIMLSSTMQRLKQQLHVSSAMAMVNTEEVVVDVENSTSELSDKIDLHNINSSSKAQLEEELDFNQYQQILQQQQQQQQQQQEQDENFNSNEEEGHGPSGYYSIPIFFVPLTTVAPPTTVPTTAEAISEPDPQFLDLTPEQYLKMAGAGDLFELASSKVILSSSPSVTSEITRAFAEKMIQDHTLLSQKAMMATMRLAGTSMLPPGLVPQLDRDHRLMLQQLMSTSTPQQREMTYLQQQLVAHQLGLMVHQSYTVNGANPVLQQLAQSAVPVVASHLHAIKLILSDMQVL